MLISSWIILTKIGNSVSIFQGREDFFYKYSSPFVITEAIGAFLFLKNNRRHHNRVITSLANASLIVYLYHMHPIYKVQYVNYGIFSKINIFSAGYFLLESIAIVIVIVICGIIISIPINSALKYIKEKVFSDERNLCK